MNNLSAILLCAISGYHAIPYTNYVFTVPPVENRISGVVVAPSNSYKVVRMEDFAFMLEMARERAFIVSKETTSFVTSQTVNSYCQLHNNAKRLSNPLHSVASEAYAPLANDAKADGYCWFTSGENAIDEPTKLGNYGSYDNTFTNFMSFCLGGEPTNLATGAVEKWKNANPKLPAIPSKDVSEIMQQMQSIGDFTLAFEDGFIADGTPFPQGVHGTHKKFVDYNNAGVHYDFDYGGFETDPSSDQYETSDIYDGFWREYHGFGFMHIKRKIKMCDYDSTATDSSESLTTEMYDSPIWVIAWDKRYIKDVEGRNRVNASSMIGYLSFRMEVEYTEEDSTYYLYDGGRISNNSNIIRNTNDWAVVVPIVFEMNSSSVSSINDYTNFCYWSASKSIGDVVSMLCSDFSEYGGDYGTGSSIPDVQTPSDFGGGHYDLVGCHSIEHRYQIDITGIGLRICVTPTPCVEYKGEGQ